jgi:hypothetical protein
VIFRDPSQGLTMAAAEILPQSVPGDLLAKLLDHAADATQRLILALVAIHALPGHEIARLLTDDLDLAAGRQVVRRGRLSHTLYLEELTTGSPPSGWSSGTVAGPSRPTPTCW